MSITSINAVIMLSIPGLFPVPQQLQGFATDDIFTTPAYRPNETLMGVDGRLSGGKVNNPKPQTFMLMADSPSCAIFDAWNDAEEASADSFTANAVVLLKAVGKKWTQTKGFLTEYTPIPEGKRTLQPRRFEITWESILPSVA